MQQVDVVILGAGAAGLMCALTAARRGRSVIILEKSNKPGKKILMSGGGRCNFTNYYIEPSRYISANPHFCKSALSRYTQYDFIKLVESHAIAYHEKAAVGAEPGQLFCDDSAKQILQMLLDECEKSSVVLLTNVTVETVSGPDANETMNATNYAYRVASTDREWLCRSLVVATGGLSIPTLGGSDLGYKLAQQFNHTLQPLTAGLVPFVMTGKIKQLIEALAGTSTLVTASTNDASFTGNLLFTHRGLSGPVMLQLSNYWQPGEMLTIDFLPDISNKDWLIQCKADTPTRKLRSVLTEYLPDKLVAQLASHYWPASANKNLADHTNVELARITGQLKQWEVKPAGTAGYRTAEVTRGGVDTATLSSKTMGSLIHPGLYFIGEVVDVTGHLGGFNFQWAWSSGVAAGIAV